MCISFSCVRVFFTRLPRLLARVTTCTRQRHTDVRPHTQLTQGWIGYFSPARPRRRRYTVYDGWRWSMWRGCSRLPARHVALPSHAPAPRQVGSTVSRWVSALGGRVLRRGVWLLGGTHRSSPQSAELTAPVERGAWSCAGLAELAVRSSAAEPRSPSAGPPFAHSRSTHLNSVSEPRHTLERVEELVLGQSHVHVADGVHAADEAQPKDPAHAPLARVVGGAERRVKVELVVRLRVVLVRPAPVPPRGGRGDSLE
mmetsp:Transcript_50355/g.164093  ORF Transcript_50355/g.164093 Transcript_50355/m.164093 type:complete len:256 (-) Transcript_50355:451-1218(-)